MTLRFYVCEHVCPLCGNVEVVGTTRLVSGVPSVPRSELVCRLRGCFGGMRPVGSWKRAQRGLW